MGIPSYFSYIIKNHMRILTKFSQSTLSFHNLYLDCNSIIYDSIREIQLKPVLSENYRNISVAVCAKIQQYIDIVRPSNTVYIAFDGVAPFAKMNQQKTRRFRSAYLEYHGIVKKSLFNSCLITPGTEFMEYLSNHVNNHFSSKPSIVVSASDVPGEGEHKLFQHIRDNASSHVGQNTVVYGLDADLLMLSIFHSQKTNLFVYREAPEFAKSLNADLENGEGYILDINRLCISILDEMNCRFPDQRRVFDYAFLCFLLGNDFLPHFPALNIRTRGIYSLIDAYKETVGRDEFAFIIENGEINWSNFKKVAFWLAKHESGWIRTEYLKRDDIRFSTNYTNDAEKEAVFNNAPLIYRATEHYINPTEAKWQSRYYKALFHQKPHVNRIPICENYYQGLEWVFRYYTDQCFDWRWKYNYHYPPLLSDLASHVVRERYFKKVDTNPFNKKTQLAYVLPPQDFDFSRVKFQWAFCRYFWESHFVMEDLSLEDMEKMESTEKTEKIKSTEKSKSKRK
jgi:5'-3' exoribonuclease 1